MTARLARFAVASVLALSATTVGVVVGAPAAFANGPCTYVMLDNAYVRENPTVNSEVRKTKYAGEYVTGPAPCTSRTGWDGRDWVPVDCTCATDGIGWIIANKVRTVDW